MTNTVKVTEGRLVDKLYSNYLSTWYTLFSLQSFHKIEDKSDLIISTPKGNMIYEQLYNEQIKNDDIEKVIKELSMISICSNYLKESFRITQDYCTSYNFEDVLYSESWYRFAKILVNCLSHNMIFSFERVNPKHLPATYGEFSILSDMEGKHIPKEFTAQMFLNLGDEILQFVARSIPNGGLYGSEETLD